MMNRRFPKKILLFCLVLLLGLTAVAAASASQTITLDSTATMKLADSLAYNKTQNNIKYYKDAKNKVTCGIRVSDGQVAMKDVKATLKKSGYKSVKVKTVNGVEMCSGTKKANGMTTLMAYFNTKDSHFVMLAFTYNPSKSKAKKIVDNAVGSVKVAEPKPAPAAPAFSWKGLNGNITSAVYGGHDLLMIYMLYTNGNNDYIEYYLNGLKPSMDKLSKKEVHVLVCLMDNAGNDELKAYSAKYPSMVFGRLDDSGDNEMWEALERLEYTKGNVSFPVVILRSRNNRLRYYAVGSLDNIKTVVKKALAMANDDVPAVPPDPDEIPDPDDETLVVGNGKYRLNANSAVFLGLVEKTVTEYEVPQHISWKGKQYPVTEIAAKACSGLTALTKLQIDTNVEKIGASAFLNCPNLKTISILTGKLTEKTIGKNAFKGIADKPQIKCPTAKLKSYKAWLIKKGVPENATFKGVIVK